MSRPPCPGEECLRTDGIICPDDGCDAAGGIYGGPLRPPPDLELRLARRTAERDRALESLQAVTHHAAAWRLLALLLLAERAGRDDTPPPASPPGGAPGE